MAESGRKLNVAVVGGGMGGLCVAIGLLKHPHINVQVFEAAHKFSEIGAGVAFGPNAQRALRLISPKTETAYLNQATHNGWKEMQNVWFEFRDGMAEDDGDVIAAPRNETGQSTVHRAKFLDEFVALIPKDIAHFGKRLVKIEEKARSGLTLHFKDETTAEVDCVIGADGVHSVCREHILGSEHPALKPVFTHSVAYRGLIPMATASEAIGERYAQNSFIFVGDGGCVMIYPIDFGKTMNIVAINSEYDHWDGPWVQPADYKRIDSDFFKWSGTARKVVALLDNEDTMAWSMWDDPPAPTYYKGNVVMMGDAAHASTPFQGQGAGQAIEDAYVLESLFEHVDSPEKITMAFEAYDRIRRPRSQQVCKTSRDSGELCAQRFPGVGHDHKAFRENMDWRMDWMWHRDVAGERDEAMIIFEKLVDGEQLNG